MIIYIMHQATDNRWHAIAYMGTSPRATMQGSYGSMSLLLQLIDLDQFDTVKVLASGEACN